MSQKKHKQGEIVAALRTRDGGAAEAGMRAHIEAAHRARLRQIRVIAAA